VSFIQVGESNLELLLPTSADSAVAKFLENKGEGFHHLALEVEDIHAAVEELKAAGVRLIDEKPRRAPTALWWLFSTPRPPSACWWSCASILTPTKLQWG